MRSERPQSFRRRSGSTPGQVGLERLGRDQLAAARLAPALARGEGCAGGLRHRRSSVSGLRRDVTIPPMRSKDEVRADVWRAMDRDGRVALPGCGGPHPQLRGRQGRRRAARAASGVDERADAQGEPRFAADPRAPARARAGQGARDGRAAAARPAPLPAARPARAGRLAAARGGHHQGRPAPRQGDRPRSGPGARPGPHRLRGGQPEGCAGGQGRRLLGPRVRAALRERQDRPPHGDRHHGPPDPDPAGEPADDRPTTSRWAWSRPRAR